MERNRTLKTVIEHSGRLVFKTQLEALKRFQSANFAHLEKFSHSQLRSVRLKSRSRDLGTFTCVGNIVRTLTYSYVLINKNLLVESIVSRRSRQVGGQMRVELNLSFPSIHSPNVKDCR